MFYLIIKMIIYSFFSYLFYSLFSKNNTNKLYNEKELLWNNETINITLIKEMIINYQNISNTSSISKLNLKQYEKVKNPKISIIIPIYNHQEFLLNCYMSIYDQSMKDIEIIFVNDASKDNSTIIIEDLMKKDKRIIHIKNNTIKRKYHSKKKGVLNAKGEYILIMNPEDLLLNNILEKAYDTIKKNNLDILQYYIIIGSYKTNRLWKNIKYKSGIIYYPKIKDYFYNSYLPQISDKLIKREIFINSMEYMTNNPNNDVFDYSFNDLAIFALSKTAKSYGFLESVGYFYNTKNSLLTVESWYKNKKVDKIFGKYFNVSKYFLENTGENRQEKLFAYKFLDNKIYKYRNKLYYLFNNFDVIDNILEDFLKCRFYNKNEKEKIQIIKNLVSYAKKLNENYTFINTSSLLK